MGRISFVNAPAIHRQRSESSGQGHEHTDSGDEGLLTKQHFFVFVVVVVYFILSRLLYLAYSVNLGLLCMSYPGMGPLV